MMDTLQSIHEDIRKCLDSLKTKKKNAYFTLFEMSHGKGLFGDDTAEILQWTRKMKNLKLSERMKSYCRP